MSHLEVLRLASTIFFASSIASANSLVQCIRVANVEQVVRLPEFPRARLRMQSVAIIGGVHPSAPYVGRLQHLCGDAVRFERIGGDQSAQSPSDDNDACLLKRFVGMRRWNGGSGRWCVFVRFESRDAKGDA